MSAADEADNLVGKVRLGKASARDALRILEGLEKIAKPEEAERLKQARAALEDAAATERELNGCLRLATFHNRFVQRARRERAVFRDGKMAGMAICK